MSKKKKEPVYEVVNRFKELNKKGGFDIFEVGDIYKSDAKRIKDLQAKGFIKEVNSDDAN